MADEEENTQENPEENNPNIDNNSSETENNSVEEKEEPEENNSHLEVAFDQLDIPQITIPEEEQILYKIFGKNGETEVIAADAAFLAIKLSKLESIIKIEQLHQDYSIMNRDMINSIIDKQNTKKDN